jgi:hypothetical protein
VFFFYKLKGVVHKGCGFFYGSETWTLVLRKENGLKVIQKRTMIPKFGSYGMVGKIT